MPSKHISYIVGDTGQLVSYQFDTIQEMIEFERFLQESTFEKYHKDQEVAREAVSEFISKMKTPINYNYSDDICPADIDFSLGKPRPWIIDWEKVEEKFGPKYKWFAVDEDGEKCVYTGCPKLYGGGGEEGKGYFHQDGEQVCVISSEFILQKGTVPWSESLVKKPEKS